MEFIQENSVSIGIFLFIVIIIALIIWYFTTNPSILLSITSPITAHSASITAPSVSSITAPIASSITTPIASSIIAPRASITAPIASSITAPRASITAPIASVPPIKLSFIPPILSGNTTYTLSNFSLPVHPIGDFNVKLYLGLSGDGNTYASYYMPGSGAGNNIWVINKSWTNWVQLPIDAMPSVAINYNGSIILTTNNYYVINGNSYKLFDSIGGTLPPRINWVPMTYSNNLSIVFLFSAGNTYGYYLTYDGNVFSSWKPIPILNLKNNIFNNINVSGDGSRVFISTNDGLYFSNIINNTFSNWITVTAFTSINYNFSQTGSFGGFGLIPTYDGNNIILYNNIEQSINHGLPYQYNFYLAKYNSVLNNYILVNQIASIQQPIKVISKNVSHFLTIDSTNTKLIIQAFGNNSKYTVDYININW